MKDSIMSIEAKLKELGSRRKLLEQKCIHRKTSIDSYENNRHCNAIKIYETAEKEYIQSKNRNQKLLEKCYDLTRKSTVNVININCATVSRHNLTQSRKSYIKQIEVLLPNWRKVQIDRVEEEIKLIQIEKQAAVMRRNRYTSDREKENCARTDLEHERNSLRSFLASEQTASHESSSSSSSSSRVSENSITNTPTFVAVARDDTCRIPEDTLRVSTDYLRMKVQEINDLVAIELLNSSSNSSAATATATITASTTSVKTVIEPISASSHEQSDLNNALVPEVLPTVSKSVPDTLPNTSIVSINDSTGSTGNITIEMPEENLDTQASSSMKLLGSPSSKCSTPPVKGPKPILPSTPSCPTSPTNRNQSLSPLLSPTDVARTSTSDTNDNSLFSTTATAVIGDPIFQSVAMQEAVGIFEKLCAKIEAATVVAVSNKELPMNMTPYTVNSKIPEASTTIPVLNFIISSVKENRMTDVDAYSCTHWCAAILALIEDMGSTIVPWEALNGIVTIDRLKKEQKKQGHGRVEGWTILSNHLQTIAKICSSYSSSTIDELSLTVSASLLKSFPVSDGEKARIERKVVRLVQLSLLPTEQQLTSSSAVTSASTVPSIPDSSSSSSSRVGYASSASVDTPKSKSYSSNNSKAYVPKVSTVLIDEDEFEEDEPIARVQVVHKDLDSRPNKADEFDF